LIAGDYLKKTTKARIFLLLSLPICLGLLLEVLAWANVRSERSARAYLGDKLFTVERGVAENPVVFIAGLEGSTRYWGNVLDVLERDHRLLFVDALGFGRSPWPVREPDIDDHVEWLRRTLLARKATAHVTIVAHSFGTILAAHYAARYPGEVERLVLLGTPIYDDPEDARTRISKMSGMAALYAFAPFAARETCLIMGAARPLLERLLPAVTRVPREVAEDAVLHDWPSINGAISNVLLSRPIAVPLATLGAKTIFVHGRTDQVTPVKRVIALAQRVGARVDLVPGDHQAYLTDGRDAVLAAIRE